MENQYLKIGNIFQEQIVAKALKTRWDKRLKLISWPKIYKKSGNISGDIGKVENNKGYGKQFNAFNKTVDK